MRLITICMLMICCASCKAQEAVVFQELETAYGKMYVYAELGEMDQSDYKLGLLRGDKVVELYVSENIFEIAEVGDRIEILTCQKGTLAQDEVGIDVFEVEGYNCTTNRPVIGRITVRD